MEELKNGVLIITEVHAWGNTKRVPKQILDKISNKEVSDWIRMNKGLIDSKHLESVNYLKTKFGNTVRAYSIASLGRACDLIPSSRILELTQKLDGIIEELKGEVDTLAESYHHYIKEAKKELNKSGEIGFFNEEDYPKDIKKKYGMHYRIVSMGVPGELETVSPELFKQETQKTKQLFEELRSEAVIFLRESFAASVAHIVEVLQGYENGTQKRIKTATIEKIEKFFEEFKHNNIFKDNILAGMINEARDIMLGIDAQDVRESSKLRQYIAKEMKKIEIEVEESVEEVKRKISLKKK